jgi:hypothetical protein
MVEQNNNKNSKNIKRQIGNKNSDIYDIVCYSDDEENSEKNVNDLIKKIEKNKLEKGLIAARKNGRFINLKLLGCLVINVSGLINFRTPYFGPNLFQK